MSNPLKIAMIARATLYRVPGGDTVQVVQTAEALRRLGCEVDVFTTDTIKEYAAYDLLHFFNIIRPADILCHIKRSKKKYLVSPVYVEYSEYEQTQRKGWAGWLFRRLSPDGIEYVKTIYRWLRGRDKLMSFSYLWLGHRRSVLHVLKYASFLLPNSHNEYDRLLKTYGIKKPYRVVPNGVNTEIFSLIPGIPRNPNLIVCAARIEGIKNQLNLIRALNGTRFQLKIVGDEAPGQPGYAKTCRAIAQPNIEFIGPLPQSQLVHLYAQASVHVLPSWFETTGLSSLEAASMGCAVVVSNKGDTKEIFSTRAYYCDPASEESIREAVEAAAAGSDTGLRNRVQQTYTWTKAAIETVHAYRFCKNDP